VKRIPTNRLAQWLRRGVASFLLALFLGIMAAPLASAQNAEASMPACCRMAGAHGCSMHLHHAQQQSEKAHHLAALSPRCPCTAMVSSSAATHSTPFVAASRLAFDLPRAHAPPAATAQVHTSVFASDTATRGPPTPFFA
jgi:hypothetical protein